LPRLSVLVMDLPRLTSSAAREAPTETRGLLTIAT